MYLKIVTWFLLISIFIPQYVNGFPHDRNLAEVVQEGYKFGNILSRSSDTEVRRERRADVNNNDKDSKWRAKQESIAKLKALNELRGEQDSEDPRGYNSHRMKWRADWSNGPVEKRLDSLNIGVRSRFGFPLSVALPGRSRKMHKGYYKELDVAGKTN